MKQQSSPGPLIAGLAITVLALAGCGQPQPVESTERPVQPPVAVEAQVPKPAREVGSVAPAAKPGAPVSLEYSLRGSPQVGLPVDVDLTFLSGGSGETLEILCSVDEALTLREGAFSLPSPGGSHTITVTPEVEGYHYINVIARMGDQARAFAVPVPVGNVDVRDTLKSQGEIVEDETGQRIIRLPAEEN